MAAETERIVTIFEGDITNLRGAVDEAVKLVGTLDKGTEKLADTERKAATEAGNIASKFRLVEGAAKGVGQAAGQVKVVATEGAKASTAAGRIATALNTAKAKAADLAATVRGKLSTAWASVKGTASEALGQVQGLLGGIGSKITGLLGSIPGLGGAFGALVAPIGLAVGAVGALLASTKKLDGVATTLDGLGRGFDLLGDRIAGAVGKLLGLQKDGGQRAVGGIFSPFGPLGFLNQDIAAGVKLANQADALADTAGAARVRVAELNKEVQALLPKLRDRTLEIADRLQIADQVTAKEEEALAVQRKAVEEELALLRLQQKAEEERLRNATGANGQQFAEGTPEFQRLAGTDETRRAIEAAQERLFNFEAQSFALLERVQARRNAVEQEAFALADKLEAEQLAAQQKAAAEAQKAAQARAQAQASIDAILLNTEQQEARALLATDLERQLFDIDQKAQDTLDNLRAQFKALRELSKPSERPAIDQQQAEAEAKLAAQADRLRAEARQKAEEELATATADAQRTLSDALATEQERQVQAVRDKYAKLLELNDRYTTDLEQRADLRAKLLAAQAKEEADLVITEEERKAEAEKEREAQRVALVEQTTQAVGQILANAATTTEDAAEQASKAVIALGLDVIQQLVLQELRRLRIIATGAQIEAQARSLATAQSAATGGVAGIVQGALLQGLIEALFQAAKGQLQSFSTGTPYVERRGHPAGVDTIPAFLDEGERVVDRRTNVKHWDLLEAMRTNRLGDYVNTTYVVPALADFLASDEGRRTTTSVTLAKYYDRNIVRSLQDNRRAVQRSNALLESIATTLGHPAQRSKRAY